MTNALPCFPADAPCPPLQWQHVDISTPLDKKEFAATLHRYPLVVVNFYAPWCPFCRRMEPSWEAATQAVHDKYPEESDGRIRFAKVGRGFRRVVVSGGRVFGGLHSL